MIAIFWTAAREVGQHSPSVQPTWRQMKHPSWKISSEACWQVLPRCRSGSTLCRLLRVTNVHENCTSIGRPYTEKYRDRTDNTEARVFLLHPGEFRFDNGWEPSLLQAVLWAPQNNIRQKYSIRYNYFSVFIYDCFFTHN